MENSVGDIKINVSDRLALKASIGDVKKSEEALARERVFNSPLCKRLVEYRNANNK